MRSITPLHKADRDTVRELAEAAVANGEPITANPFPPEHPNHQHWKHDFRQFDTALAGVG